MSYKYENVEDPIFLKVAEQQQDKTCAKVTPTGDLKVPLGKDWQPPHCVLTIRHKLMADKIKNFQVYPDDTWLISYPKSGTTWSQEMIWCLANDLDYEKAKETLFERFPFLDIKVIRDLPHCMHKHPFEMAQNMKRPRFIKSHLPVALLPDQLWTVKPKIVYIRRNPKDVVVSYFHHSKNMHGYEGPIEDFVELFLADLALYSPFHSHTIEFNTLQDTPNLLLLRFEDMKSNLEQVVRKSMEFLGKSYSDEQIAGLCEHLSFASMKENKAVNYENLMAINKPSIPASDPDNARFIRKGQVGAWKTELSKEFADRIDEWTRDAVKDENLRKLFDMK